MSKDRVARCIGNDVSDVVERMTVRCGDIGQKAELMKYILETVADPELNITVVQKMVNAIVDHGFPKSALDLALVQIALRRDQDVKINGKVWKKIDSRGAYLHYRMRRLCRKLGIPWGD